MAGGSSNRVQWAADAAGTVTEDVGADHGGADVAVAEELLGRCGCRDLARGGGWRRSGGDLLCWRLSVVGCLGRMRSRRSFVEAGRARSNPDGALRHALVEKMRAFQASRSSLVATRSPETPIASPAPVPRLGFFGRSPRVAKRGRTRSAGRPDELPGPARVGAATVGPPSAEALCGGPDDLKLPEA